MEIEVLQKDDKNMRLLIHGVDTPYMNALRRTIISEVPSMAVDEVVILENSSVLQDEIIAHRLGLIPLKTDLESYNLPEECECKSEFGCGLCRVTLTLDVEAKEGTKTVYSGSLISENPAIIPVSDKIPIVKLAKEQKIRLEAYARLGKGKNHAKWQPVSACVYKYLPHIQIDAKKCNVCGKCMEVCSKKVLIKSETKMDVGDILSCTLCQDCVDACPQEPEAIKIDWAKDSFIFNIESSGALPPEVILTDAVEILDERLKMLEDEIKVRKSEED
jgi:DNA-directed RNA polymerase subunit D